MKRCIPALLIIFLFFGCGGGGGGSNSSSSEPTLMISSSEAVPGSFITIEDDSIEADEELDVTFENKSGYEVTIKTILTKDGAAGVPVPPIANLSTGDLIPSKVTVSIPSGGQATLNVLPLPELSGVAPGDVVKMYLSYIKSSLETSLDNMDEFALEFIDYDTSELEQQIQTQINSIEACINEIETSSQMSIYSYYDGKIILDQDVLGKLDQLLFAVLKGAMDEDLKLAAEESVVSASVNMLSDNASDLAQVTSWVKSNIKNSKVLLVGAGGMVVTVSGALIGTAAAGTSALYAFQAGTVTVLVIGVASEGIAAIEAAGDPNKKYEFGNEITKEIEDAIKDLAVAAGAEKSSVINLYSFLDTKDDAAEALFNLICNSDPIPAGFEDYCKKWEASHQPKPLAIKLIRFEDKVMVSGDEGELSFHLEGNKDAGKVEITIDWGDTDGTVKSLNPNHIYSGSESYPGVPIILKYPWLNHRYTIVGAEDAKRFIIRVSAEDSDGNIAGDSTIVEVRKKLELSAAFSSLPSRIKTNTKRAWGVAVKGGKPPYTYKMYWGDEITEGIFDTAGDSTLNHKYTSPGIYTVSIEVTDANDVSVSDTSVADVRDPVSIVSITGPTSLDWDETGTWAVILDGGWGAYTASSDWDDYSIPPPVVSQTRQFNISHAFKKEDPKQTEDTFSVLVTVIDDEGDMDDKGFTVKVPKTDPTFAYTSTNICEDFDDPIIRHGMFTINDNNTITIFEIESEQTMTTELTGDNFIFQQIWGDLTLVFEGTIDIDESTGVITGSGTMNTYRSDGSISCEGTWTSG